MSAQPSIFHCPNCEEELDASKITKRFYCKECEEVKEEDELQPKYNCGSCGEEFTRENSADGDSNRCPSCNKFGAIECDNACDSCENEVEEVDVIECEDCGAFTPVEDAKNVKVGPSKPKVPVVKFPYKRGQEFKIKTAYSHESLTGMGAHVLHPNNVMGANSSILKIFSFEKGTRLGFRYAMVEVSQMLPNNQWTSSGLTAMRFEEILEHWTPITYREARDYVVASRKCEHCEKLGADYREVLKDFTKPTFPNGDIDDHHGFVCDSCYEESHRISEPIESALRAKRMKTYEEELRKDGIVCEQCKAKYPQAPIGVFTFMPKSHKEHMKLIHKEKKNND